AQEGAGGGEDSRWFDTMARVVQWPRARKGTGGDGRPSTSRPCPGQSHMALSNSLWFETAAEAWGRRCGSAASVERREEIGADAGAQRRADRAPQRLRLVRRTRLVDPRQPVPVGPGDEAGEAHPAV